MLLPTPKDRKTNIIFNIRMNFCRSTKISLLGVTLSKPIASLMVIYELQSLKLDSTLAQAPKIIK